MGAKLRDTEVCNSIQEGGGVIHVERGLGKLPYHFRKRVNLKVKGKRVELHTYTYIYIYVYEHLIQLPLPHRDIRHCPLLLNKGRGVDIRHCPSYSLGFGYLVNPSFT